MTASNRDKLNRLKEQLGLKTGAQVEEEHAAQPAQSKAPMKPLGGSRGSGGPGAHQTARDLAERLGRLGVAASRSGEPRYVSEPVSPGAEEDEESVGLLDLLGGEIVGAGDDGFFLLRRDFPLEHRHGNITLGSALLGDAKWIALSAADPELEGFDPRHALFMDTETTGLAGGTGTMAFLVGVGYFHEDVFRLDQCFLRDYGDEESMLEFLAERFKQCRTVVGYNSKSFDLPLLRTRFIQNRLPFRLDGIAHYDLVHAARRFWKRRLRDCSLGNIERRILDIERSGDVPGYLIPQFWFDYLESGNARPLEGVFYHHRMDILSLVALTGWLARQLAEPSGDGFLHAEDKLSLVRVHFLQKRWEETIHLAHRYLESDACSSARRECLGMLAAANKRLDRYGAMQDALECLLREFPEDMQAYLELAKHLEHRTKDLSSAAALCEAALRLATDAEADEFSHRLARIRAKQRRLGPPPPA